MKFRALRFRLQVWIPVLACGLLSALAAPLLRAADTLSPMSCAEFRAPRQTVNGQSIGQQECHMLDGGVVDPERRYHRLEIGVSGTASGWIVKEGPRSNHFTTAPDFVFAQIGNKSQRFHGVLHYLAAKGTSMTLLYPETGWNGKLFVMAHGSGGSFLTGSMKSWERYLDRERPMADVTKYEKAMLAKGYAVARTRRNAERDAPGDFSVVLDDGQLWPDQNISQVPEIILDMARLARNLLQSRLGQAPSRTYWYGHSGGVMLGSLINYMPDLNQGEGGKPLIDGMIWDDPGGGLWLPILMRQGKDVLFATPQERARFVKTLEIAHQAYPGAFTSATPWEMDLKSIPEFISPVYLNNKRRGARVFRAKGMEDRFRMYEVRGVSHSGGENLENGKRGDIQILDLSRLMDGVIDLLDNWVEKGTEPPATRSDLAALGDRDSNKIVESPAVDLPETACPLGVYFAYPPSLGAEGVASTGFASFDGTSLEPMDGRIQHVDMNGNLKRDQRETVNQAWHRLGLLKSGEVFNRTRYVECVKAAAAKLLQERLITESVAGRYTQEAETQELPR